MPDQPISHTPTKTLRTANEPSGNFLQAAPSFPAERGKETLNENRLQAVMQRGKAAILRQGWIVLMRPTFRTTNYNCVILTQGPGAVEHFVILSLTLSVRSVRTIPWYPCPCHPCMWCVPSHCRSPIGEFEFKQYQRQLSLNLPLVVPVCIYVSAASA